MLGKFGGYEKRAHSPIRTVSKAESDWDTDGEKLNHVWGWKEDCTAAKI